MDCFLAIKHSSPQQELSIYLLLSPSIRFLSFMKRYYLTTYHFTIKSTHKYTHSFTRTHFKG